MFLLFLLAIPTGLVYLVVRAGFKRLSKVLATIVAAHLVMLTWWGLNRPEFTLYDWVHLLVALALLSWLGLRPGRSSIIALLVYQILGSFNLVLALKAPWGDPLHRIAVTGVVLQVSMAMLLIRELRTQVGKTEAPHLLEDQKGG